MKEKNKTFALSEKIKRKALELGYVKVGITNADDFTYHRSQLETRYGYEFFRTDSRNPLGGCSPRSICPEAKSIISVVYNYGFINFPENLVGKIGRAYQARCYNAPKETINGARAQLFRAFLENNGLAIFDNIFVPDRAAGARAGTVTFGKNNFAYAGEYGSFIVLTSFIVDAELVYDSPTEKRQCPSNCRLCIDSCPTGAISDEGHLNPQKCIAFNNWNEKFLNYPETRIPYDICEKIGSRVHGCDVCQEVCPRNKKALEAPKQNDIFLNKIAEEFDLGLLLTLNDEYYHSVVEPIMYNYIKDYEYFKRNAAIAIGNIGDIKYLPYLKKALNDKSPLVKEYTVWALKKIKQNCDGEILKEIESLLNSVI